MSQPNLKATLPKNSLDSYASAAKEIEQEKQMVAELKRLSIGHLMHYDPDLPVLDTASYPFAVDRLHYVESNATRDDSSVESSSSASSPGNRFSFAELNVGNCNDNDVDPKTHDADVSRGKENESNKPLGHRSPLFIAPEDPMLDQLLWVPANMHPEINPQQFKNHMEATFDEFAEQKIMLSLSQLRSKRSSLLFLVTDTDTDDSTAFVPKEDPNKRDHAKKQYSNPSLRKLTSELQAMSREAGMDASDAVTLARTLSRKSMGYSDIEKLAFDELGNSTQAKKNIYLAERPQEDFTGRTLPKVRPNSSTFQEAFDENHQGLTHQGQPMGTNVAFGGHPQLQHKRISSDEEEFPLRRSRRPDYKKGPYTTGGIPQLGAQKLGSQFQSHKADRLVLLRQSLLSSSIAQVAAQRAPETRTKAAEAKETYVQPRSGSGSGRTPSQHRDGPVRYWNTPPYFQSGHPSNAVPVGVIDSALHAGFADAHQRPYYSAGSISSPPQSRDSRHESENGQNLKGRSMSSSALYGYASSWPNVPMRSASDLMPSQYSGGWKPETQNQAYLSHSPYSQQYPSHPAQYPLYSQQYAQNPQYIQHQHQSYTQKYQNHGQHYGSDPRYARQNHNGQYYQQQQQQQQHGYYGGYGISPQIQYTAREQSGGYNAEKDTHPNEHVFVPKKHDRNKRTREPRPELNENLDLLRNEINEFKESLLRTEPAQVPVKQSDPDAEKAEAAAEDFSFDLTSHNVSYEDELGIDREIRGEVIPESLSEGPVAQTTPEPPQPTPQHTQQEQTESVQPPDVHVQPPDVQQEDAQVSALSVTPPARKESFSANGETVQPVLPKTRAENRAKQTRKVAKSLQKKSSLSLLALRLGKKKAKQPWPWSKETSDRAEAKTDCLTDAKLNQEGIVSGDVSEDNASEDASKDAIEVVKDAKDTKDNVISKFFKKTRSLSSGERNMAGRWRSSSEFETQSRLSSYSLLFEESSRANSTKENAVPAENVKSRLKQKLKNIGKSHDNKHARTWEPLISKEPVLAESAPVTLEIAPARPMTTQEVQDRLKKSIKRASRANQPIEFTDSAFGFPLPPPSHSTLIMIDYRFAVHVERAIYRLSHLKLANPKRSLREQVLLSNFMYAYLNLVDHTLHLEEQMLKKELAQPVENLLGLQDDETERKTDSLDEESFDLMRMGDEIAV